eukprot:m.32027 g.32027  ORF g.32027 m.32027 type:complete len:173 (-) comp42168_c0_seq2:8-526(-)
MFQLAFFLELRSILSTAAQLQAFAYDPMIHPTEQRVLLAERIEWIERNELAKRRVLRPTLFFMPHCDRWLYNNLLWANWGPVSLPNVCILGNSFGFYDQNTATRKLKDEAPFLHMTLPFVIETAIPNTFSANAEAFSSLSLHQFEHKALLEVPSSIWEQLTEPPDPEQVLTK